MEVPATDTSRRDEFSDGLVDTLDRHVDTIVDALATQLTTEVPAAIGWTPGQNRRVRDALEELVRGYLRYLRIGDLEATDCERLREIAETPLPGVPADGTSELLRTLRSTLLIAVADPLPDLDVDPQRFLRLELEGYIALLSRPGGRMDQVGELDPWLARIASAGRDIRSDEGGTTTP